jgi:hypothetical protein
LALDKNKKGAIEAFACSSCLTADIPTIAAILNSSYDTSVDSRGNTKEIEMDRKLESSNGLGSIFDG